MYGLESTQLVLVSLSKFLSKISISPVFCKVRTVEESNSETVKTIRIVFLIEIPPLENQI